MRHLRPADTVSAAALTIKRGLAIRAFGPVVPVERQYLAIMRSAHSGDSYLATVSFDIESHTYQACLCEAGTSKDGLAPQDAMGPFFKAFMESQRQPYVGPPIQTMAGVNDAGHLAIGGALPNDPLVDPLGLAEGLDLMRGLFDRLITFRPIMLRMQAGALSVEEGINHLCIGEGRSSQVN